MTDARPKLRTVKVNDRGQLVIPEDVRKDLRIEGETVLVLVERRGEIVLRREEDVLKDLDDFWTQVRRRSLERAWEPEDDVWQAYHDQASS